MDAAAVMDDAAGGGNDRVQQGLVVHCKNLFLVIRKFFWIALQPLSLTYGLPSPLLGEVAEAWTERFGAIMVFWYQYDRFFEKGIEQICNKSRLFSGKLGPFWAEYLL